MAAAVPGLVTRGFASEAWNAPDVKENIEPAHDWMYRRMQYFEDPSQLEGRRFLVDLLFMEQVFLREIFDASAESAPVLPAGSLSRIAAITATQVAGAAIYPDISSRSLQPDRPQALNFVCGWDAHTATLIIIFPTVLSIVVGIAWPTRAVLKYGADVQTSVQTGVSVASYIVTAGALLIALAAWYDSVTTHEELKEEKGE